MAKENHSCFTWPPVVEPLSITYQLLNAAVQLGSFKWEESSHNTHPQHLHPGKGLDTTRQGWLFPLDPEPWALSMAHSTLVQMAHSAKHLAFPYLYGTLGWIRRTLTEHDSNCARILVHRFQSTRTSLFNIGVEC